MHELVWFLLGASLYGILSSLLDMSKKAKFIRDIKVLAILLIGQAFEELLKMHLIKYSILNSPHSTVSEEEIKLLKNEDEAFLLKWKKNTLATLNHSVPPIYHSAVDLEDWKEVTNTMMVLREDYVDILEDINEKQKR